MWKTLHDHIISLIGYVWAHKTSLTPPPFIKVSVSYQESELSCICVLGVHIVLVFTNFLNIALSVSLKLT
jgi:hypothetical protein